MNAFTQAPDGFEWVNSSDGSEYTRAGGVWVGEYPTSETPRGLWVDGKTLYQRTFTGTITQSGGVRNALNILTGVDSVIAADGYFTGSDGGKYLVSQTTGNDALTTVFHFSYLLATGSGVVTLNTRSDQARTNAPYAVSIWYTKR